MSWKDSDLTEEPDYDPTLKTAMIPNAGRVTVTFMDDGERIDTQHGDAVKFGIRPQHASENVRETDKFQEEDGLGEAFALDGEEAVLLTSSRPLLRALAEHDVQCGEKYVIERKGEEEDTSYTVIPKDE